jgi:molybdenum cofactor cytidylyltransferase
MASNTKIAAIVLAAGLSRRSGLVNKLLYPVDGTVMVRKVVEMLASSTADPVIVVTGFEAPEVETSLSGLPVNFAHNQHFNDGMGSSISRGIKALPDDVDGVLICLGDMPHIKASTIDALIEASQEKNICVPINNGRQGNPVLFPKNNFQALEGLKGDRGGKALIQNNDRLVVEVTTEDTGIFIDHDDVG